MKYGLKVEAPQVAGQERIFTPEALEFILGLEKKQQFILQIMSGMLPQQ